MDTESSRAVFGHESIFHELQTYSSTAIENTEVKIQGTDLIAREGFPVGTQHGILPEQVENGTTERRENCVVDCYFCMKSK